jgi:hypothetical protein
MTAQHMMTDGVRVLGDEQSGRRVVAIRTLHAGEVLAELSGAERVAVPTRFTVQVDVDAHIDGLWQFTFLNHSCAPNVRIDTTAMTISATRDIAAGEELGYFYPSTEWRMAEPFDCHCGAAACVGRVTGAAELPADVLAQHWVNRHITTLRAGL